MIDGPAISHWSRHQPSRPGANICLLMTVGPLLNITHGMVNYTSHQHCWPLSESVYWCPNVHSKIWFHSGMFESSAVTSELHCWYFTSELAPTIQTWCTVRVSDLSLIVDGVYLVYMDLAYWDALGYQDSNILAALTPIYQQLQLQYTSNSNSDIPATLTPIKTGNVIAWYNLPSHGSHLLSSYAHSLCLQAARSTDQTHAQLLICRYTATGYPKRSAWHWLVASWKEFQESIS